MPARGNSRANENRRIRQEALREQLEAQGHVQHVAELARKLADLDEELDQLQVTRLRAAIDGKKILIDKYLPTLKQVDSTVDATIKNEDMTVEEMKAEIARIDEQLADSKKT